MMRPQRRWRPFSRRLRFEEVSINSQRACLRIRAFDDIAVELVTSLARERTV